MDDEERATRTESPAAGEGGAIPVEKWTFAELMALSGMDAAAQTVFAEAGNLAIQPGGWQSWSAGWELVAGETLPTKVRFIPELLKQTNREGDTSGKGWIAGHFITYLRVGERYLCIASRDGGGLPPVSFRIHREQQTIIAEVFCPGKTWKAGETMAELTVFCAQGYFNFKDTLRLIYQQGETFKALSFLAGGGDRRPGGYESWYNHYTDINEKLILEDLDGLGQTDNLIKLWYIDKQKPVVFQIDDGWEKAVGEWEVDTRRFPDGLAPVAATIAAAGYIPGLVNHKR